MAKRKTKAPRARQRQRIEATQIVTLAESAPEADQADGQAIYARIELLKRRYQDRISKDEEYERLYLMKRDENTREGEEQIVSSKSFDVVNMATDMLSTLDPLIDIPPLSDSSEDQAQADELEQFCHAALFTWQSRSVRPIISQIAYDAVLLGRLCVRLMLIEDPGDGLPIRIQVRDPKYVYPEFDEDGRLWGLAEVFKRRMGDVRRVMPALSQKLHQAVKVDSAKDKEQDDEEMVEWAEWWDAVRYIYFVNGAEVFREFHEYGRLPYIFRYGRYRRAVDPSEEAISLLKGAVNTAYAYDRMLSAKATAAMNNVFSAWVAITENQEQARLSLEPNAINYLRPGEDFRPLQRQGNLPDLDSLIEAIKDEVDNTTFRAVMGQASKETSGYAFNQMTRGEKMKINPIKQSMDFALGKVFELMFDIVARSGQTVTLMSPRVPGMTDHIYHGEISLSPATARQVKHVYVSIPPDLLQDMQLNTSLALQVTAGQAPLMDRDTARRKYLHVYDTTQVEKRLAKQQIFQVLMPAFVQYAQKLLGMEQPQPAPQAPQAVPPNGGMPVTTPGSPMTPDSEAGVPPLAEGSPMNANNEAVNQMLGRGMPPQQAMAMMAARGTPQAAGEGR